MLNADEHGGPDAVGVGRWFAVGSELPCSVIVMLFIGQFIGSSLNGSQGATYGALIGAFLGLIFGAYSVYATVQFYDRMEQQATKKKPFMPPMDEILEEPEFLQDDHKESET